MKNNYNRSISLRCITCGATDFDFNQDKTWVKCTTCNREYTGGYDELVARNKQNISSGIEEMKQEVMKDLKADLTAKFKTAFKGNKNFKFK